VGLIPFASVILGFSKREPSLMGPCVSVQEKSHGYPMIA
jgi:hypothetical protein